MICNENINNATDVAKLKSSARHTGLRYIWMDGGGRVLSRHKTQAAAKVFGRRKSVGCSLIDIFNI